MVQKQCKMCFIPLNFYPYLCARLKNLLKSPTLCLYSPRVTTYVILYRKMKFSIKDFFSKCDQIRRNLRIWSHLPKKSLMENFIFLYSTNLSFLNNIFSKFELEYKHPRKPIQIWNKVFARFYTHTISNSAPSLWYL